MKRTSKGIAFTEIVLSTFKLNGAFVSDGDHMCTEEGLSSSLWQVLGAASAKPMSPAEIGRFMGLARQSVHRSSKILVEKGLCEFIANPNHKASSLLQITDKGKKAIASLDKKQIPWANESGKKISLSDLQTTAKTLRILFETWKK